VWSSGERTDLPYLWLRDNCGCPECRVVQTSEKRFHLFRVPSDLRPREAGIEGAGSADEAISIAWPDGHRTRYRSSEIRGLLGLPRFELRHWDGGFEPGRFDYGRFLSSDRAAAELIEEFLRTGVCVLVDAPTEPDSSEQLTARLGPIREVLFERIHNVKVDPKGYNIAHTGLAVAPHNDFTSYNWPPSVQLLHMLVNECEGGDSSIVDGFGVLDGLRRDHPDKFDVLCSVRVPFRLFGDHDESYAVNPMVELDADRGQRPDVALQHPADAGRPPFGTEAGRLLRRLSRAVHAGERRRRPGLPPAARRGDPGARQPPRAARPQRAALTRQAPPAGRLLRARQRAQPAPAAPPHRPHLSVPRGPGSGS
jgi:hypothetical protein